MFLAKIFKKNDKKTKIKDDSNNKKRERISPNTDSGREPKK